MKKILAHLTGIVCVIAILIAGGCSSVSTSKKLEDPETVKIYLKAKEIDGKMHLKMYDSNNRGNKVIDKLETEVSPGSTVIWKRTWFSGIKELKKISSKSDDGKLFRGDAQPIPNTKRFKLEIPTSASSGDKEAYDIVFVDKKNNEETPIDPYLKIR